MKKIVIIEDNQVIQHILRSWFSEEDFQVVSLDSIEGLTNKVRLFKPDLIITDIMIPNTTADELITVFNEIHVPIIVISSMDAEDVLFFAARIDAIGSFTKPIHLNELFGFIHDFFNNNLNKKASQL